jgi:hypothetical protein
MWWQKKVKFYNVEIDKDCLFEFSGNSNEVKEFFSIVEEKIVKEGETDDGTFFVKTTKMKFHFDGEHLWFFFIKRPYYYLEKRIREKNFECWFKVF